MSNQQTVKLFRNADKTKVNVFSEKREKTILRKLKKNKRNQWQTVD